MALSPFFAFGISSLQKANGSANDQSFDQKLAGPDILLRGMLEEINSAGYLLFGGWEIANLHIDGVYVAAGSASKDIILCLLGKAQGFLGMRQAGSIIERANISTSK